MAELPLDAPETLPIDTPNKKSHNLLRQFIGSSMQNLESVAQKMGELPHDAPETPPSDTPFMDEHFRFVWRRAEVM